MNSSKTKTITNDCIICDLFANAVAPVAVFLQLYARYFGLTFSIKKTSGTPT